MAKKSTLLVDMQPVGRRIEIESGMTLLDASQSAGVGLVSLCGGEGWCDSCLVRIASGEVNPATQSEMDSIGEERIKDGYRLACQVIPLSDVRIDIPPESLSTPQRLQVEGKDFEISIAPIWVPPIFARKYPLRERRITQIFSESSSDSGHIPRTR